MGRNTTAGGLILDARLNFYPQRLVTPSSEDAVVCPVEDRAVVDVWLAVLDAHFF